MPSINTLTCGRIALLLLAFAGLAPIQAQESAKTNLYGKVSIASPTAASLGKYADIPVNYHTGIPQISVPLYTIKEGPLSLPIGLSYHAGGMKVQEPASWVGAGWALNAGGVITRTVVGGPDEKGTSAFHYFGHFSDYGYASYLTTHGFPGSFYADDTPDKFNISRGHSDTEPDLFFFNFNGYSGKFYFSDDRTPVLVDNADLKIDYYYPTPGVSGGSVKSANIQGFIITTPNGDKYHFGITDASPITGADPVETTFPFSVESNGLPDQVYSSYYLRKVVAADGVHEIKLTYTGEKYSYYTTSMIPINGNNIQPGLQRKEYALIKNNIDGVRLAKIAFSAGYVDFNGAQTPRRDLGKHTTNVRVLFDEPNDEAKALDNVAIHGTDLCKTFTFNYTYFEDNGSQLAHDFIENYNITTDKTRLKLTSVAEKSCDGTAVTPPWRFEYDGNFLPRRLSFAQDHWGFYNGQTANNALNTLIPTFSRDPLVPAQTTNANASALTPGADRDSAWPAMAKGTLTKITYPTGGSATFVYEPNTAWISYTAYEERRKASAVAGSNAGGTLAPPALKLPPSADGYKLTLRLDVIGSTSGSAFFYGPGNSLSVSKDKPYAEIILPPTTTLQEWTLRADDNSGPVYLAEAQVYERVIVPHQENALAGGLRIKTVTSQAGLATPPVVTGYTYEQNGQSTATLYSRPRYVQIIRNDIVAQYGYDLGDGTDPHPNFNALGCMRPDFAIAFTPFIASPSPIVPMSTTQGSHIGYDEVSVTQSGNGRTDYYYYGAPYDKRYEDVCYRVIDPRVCDPKIPSSPVVPLPFDFNRGQLKFERVFNEAGQMLKENQYTYQYDSSKTITPVYIVKWVTEGGWLPNYYEKKAYWKTQMNVLETMMAAAGQAGLQTKKTYAYNSPYHRQLTRLTTTFSATDVLETRNKYVNDFRVAASDAIDDGTAAYNSACVACDQQLIADAAACSFVSCTKVVYNASRVCRANARRDYVAYRRRRFTNVKNDFQTAHDAAKNSADTGLRPILQLQDDYTNTLVETSNWKNNALLSASYTAFGPGLNQPETMYPAKVFSLPLTSPAATFAPATITGTGIHTDPRYAATPETTLTFDQGNLVELLPRNGSVTSYLWGYANTLPVATATGSGYTLLSAAYRSAGGNLTSLRTAPQLVGALLSTYAYKPLVGLTSQTDPAGRTVTYEYDALGRLIRTRDEQGRILSQQQYHYAGH